MDSQSGCFCSHPVHNGHYSSFQEAPSHENHVGPRRQNHFGEFLDTARREPVVVTRNDRPVCILISIEDAADTLLPEFLLDRESGYDGWLFDKVTTTLRRLDQGETAIHEHGEAMSQLQERLRARLTGQPA